MTGSKRNAAIFVLFSLVSIHSLRAQNPDVLTWHNGNLRWGSNYDETVLTLANVNSKSFGKIGFHTTEGKVDAEPLFASSVTINGVKHGVVYVVTEHDKVYAFDFNGGATLWKRTLLFTGETTSDDRGCSGWGPEIGVTSTPVIDPDQGPNGAMYVVSMSKDSSGVYYQRIHALDLSTGSELFGGPTEIQATYPGTGANSSNGKVVFDPAQYTERPALLEWNGNIYTTWASHCDIVPYTGWIIAYSASTLHQTEVLNFTPNGSDGAIWMSGAGPAANQNRIMLLDGNGTFDNTLNSGGMPANGNFGNAFVNISKTSAGGLQVGDYYATDTTVQQSAGDVDLGSGGVLMLPNVYDNSGMVHYLAVGAGKDTNIYLVDRLNMGKYHPNGGYIYQLLSSALPSGAWSSPAYFDAKVYYGGVSDYIRAFHISNAKLETTPSSLSSNQFPYPGATPSISSNDLANGILWAVEHSATEGVLYAYNAQDLSEELYNSTQAGTRDLMGASVTFTTPMITGGKVYVGTATGVAVFGLLPK